MKRQVCAGAALAAAACLGAAACGGGTDAPGGSPRQTTAQPPSAEPAPGPFLGLCGSVTDGELSATTGIPQPMHVVRDPVGCQWDVGELGEGAHASFTWYRGSPIGRERAIDNAVGRDVRDVTIEGAPGFSSRYRSTLCEVGVQYGDDFFLWSIDYGAGAARPPHGDVCDAAQELATMTAERAQ